MLNDSGNADRFADMFGDIVLYYFGNDTWYIWDGKRWKKDKQDQIYRYAERSVSVIYDNLLGDEDRRRKLAKFASRSLNRPNLTNLLKSARWRVPAGHSVFDSDPYLFNCGNGEIDLRNGNLYPHRQGSLNTKISPFKYDPGAESPTWDRFLNEVFQSDQEKISFLQLAVGYSLVGDVSEQVLFILPGSGANGKTTLLKTILEVMGDYGAQTSTDFLVTTYSNHSTELENLRSYRFISAVEADANRKFDEVLIKSITGGDRIRCRRIYSDTEEFEPTQTIFFATNRLPELTDTSIAMRRRLRFIPFDVTIPEGKQNKRMTKELIIEAEGILAWAVEGAMRWYKDGLPNPEFSKTIANQYMDDMDILAKFIEDCCVREGQEGATVLYEEYREWCRVNGEDPVTHTKFGRNLRERGFEKNRGSEGRYYYQGISISR
jgi:putative DNA primase/helicase